MRLDAYLPVPAPRTPAPTPTGAIPFRTDRLPTRREVAAALSLPEPDCVGMVDGGVCCHGLNAHRTSAGRSGILTMSKSLANNLAAMSDAEQQERIDIAARLLDAEQAAAAEAGLAGALQDLAAALYTVGGEPETS